MNDLDLRTIRNRLIGGHQHLANLEILGAVLQAGFVVVAGERVNLIPPQKKALKAHFLALAGKVEAHARTIATPTGKMGAVDQTILKHIQDAPPRIFGYFRTDLEDIQRLSDLEPAELPDGTFGMILPDDRAQMLADKLETLASGIKFVVGVERVKVKEGQ